MILKTHRCTSPVIVDSLTSRFLIDRGSDINSRNRESIIPLYWASRCGHVDIAQLLLDRGSDVNVRDSQSWTPLLSASRYGHVDVARLLQ
jgi:ankyrin repeat protein